MHGVDPLLHTDKRTRTRQRFVGAGAMTLQHGAAEENGTVFAQVPCVMMANKKTHSASAAATQRVRECKAALFRTLQRRHRDAWRTYWTTFQQYLMAKQSIEQFHSMAESLLGPDNIHLHNAFVVALLQDCSEKAESTTDYQGDSGVSTGDSEESNSDNVAVKVENGTHQQQHDQHDAESAELLMGLGRFVGRQ